MNETQTISEQQEWKDHLLLFISLAIPAVTAHFMARCLAAAYPDAVFYPTGAWCLYLGVYMVYVGDRLVEAGRVPAFMKAPLWATMAVALIAGTWLSLTAPWRLLPVGLGLAVVALLYGTLKRGPLWKTMMVGTTWWVGTTLLPFHLTGRNELDWGLIVTAPSIAFALMMAMSSMLYDVKDFELDTANGVRSLPVLVGIRGAWAIIAAVGVVSIVIACYGRAWAVALESVLMLILMAFPSVLKHPHWGPIVVELVQIAPGIIPLSAAGGFITSF